MTLVLHQIALLASLVNWFVIGKSKWQLVSHPLNVAARVLKWMCCDRWGASRAYGFVFALSLCLVSGTFGLLLHMLFSFNRLGWGLEVMLVSALLAHRDLLVHVKSVVDGSHSTNVPIGKHELPAIVDSRGLWPRRRETHKLCIHGLIEAFNSAALLPLFYYLMGGLPGLMVFKLVKLADSTLGDSSCVNSAVAPRIAKLADILSSLPFAAADGMAFCFVNLVKAARDFLRGKSKYVLQFSRFAEGFSVGAAEGTRVKRCEVLVCAAYLFVLAWGVFEFCDFNFKTGGLRA
ncbi:MAG: cobalamin biosynthesis protein [Candidatus Hodgkinia cicadicola]